MYILEGINVALAKTKEPCQCGHLRQDHTSTGTKHVAWCTLCFDEAGYHNAHVHTFVLDNFAYIKLVKDIRKGNKGDARLIS